MSVAVIKSYMNMCKSYNRWRKENRTGVGIEKYRKRHKIYLKAKKEWEQLCAQNAIKSLEEKESEVKNNGRK